jgi:hypothetical protein
MPGAFLAAGSTREDADPMPRLVSALLTEAQVRDRTKAVTRLNGWCMLRPGDQLALCSKVMGRPGEPLGRVTDVEVMLRDSAVYADDLKAGVRRSLDVLR